MYGGTWKVVSSRMANDTPTDTGKTASITFMVMQYTNTQ